MSARTLPFPTAGLWCERAERLVLCGLLREPDLNVPAVCRWVTADDLYANAHQVVFRAVVGRWNEFLSVDLADVFLWLVRRGEAVELGHNPALYLADLYLEDPVGSEAGYHARWVRWHSERRQAVYRAKETIRDAVDGAGEFGPARLMAAEA